MGQGVVELVETIDQAIFGERVDLKDVLRAVWQRYGLLFEVDLDRQIRRFGDARQQIGHDRLRQADRQKTVLDAVAVENVAKTRRYHNFNAIVMKRPDRILARRAATEIDVADDDARVSTRGFIQHELGALGAIFVEPQVVKKILAETPAARFRKKAGGNDLIRVDIRLEERGCPRFQSLERPHVMPREASCARRSDDP